MMRSLPFAGGYASRALRPVAGASITAPPIRTGASLGWARLRSLRFRTRRPARAPRPPVRRLRPVMRPEEKVGDRGPGGGGDEKVIGGHQRQRFRGSREPPLPRRDHGRQGHYENPRERKDIDEHVARLPPAR